MGLGALVDAQAITLGNAGNYAVFAATSIASSGLTVIGPKIGTSPGTTITGFTLLQLGLNGGQDQNNAAAKAAATDLKALYNTLAGLTPNSSPTGLLGGVLSTLTPGVYKYPTGTQLIGALTFDGQGNANSVFVIQVGGDFNILAAASVLFINGARPCNVYYQVAGNANLVAAAVFNGNLIASGSITANTGSTILLGGGLYSVNGGVSLFVSIIDPIGIGACGAGVAAAPQILTTTATVVTTATVQVTLAPQTITLPASTITASGVTVVCTRFR